MCSIAGLKVRVNICSITSHLAILHSFCQTDGMLWTRHWSMMWLFFFVDCWMKLTDMGLRSDVFDVCVCVFWNVFWSMSIYPQVWDLWWVLGPDGSLYCLMVAVALIRVSITILQTVAVQLTRSCISNIKERYTYHRLCKMWSSWCWSRLWY